MAQQQLDLVLDRRSDVPLGTQLTWKLRGAIASGALQPGDRLPGLRDLAEAADVNVNTVRAVLARLAEQGVVVSEHGRGTFVAQGIEEQSDLRELARRAAGDARRLGVDPRELAALLYADAPPAPTDEAAARRALRAEIDSLEAELAELHVRLGVQTEGGPARRGAARPRILGSAELEKVRDRLAAQVADGRVRLSDAATPAPAAEEREAWPELLFSRRPAPGGAS